MSDRDEFEEKAEELAATYGPALVVCIDVALRAADAAGYARGIEEAAKVLITKQKLLAAVRGERYLTVEASLEQAATEIRALQEKAHG